MNTLRTVCLQLIGAALLATSLSGCVVVPAQPAYQAVPVVVNVPHPEPQVEYVGVRAGAGACTRRTGRADPLTTSSAEAAAVVVGLGRTQIQRAVCAIEGGPDREVVALRCSQRLDDLANGWMCNSLATGF